MSPKQWQKKFNQVINYNDLKALKEISPNPDVFQSVKSVVMDSHNSKNRDITEISKTKFSNSKRGQQYSPFDYFKQEDSMAGYLDSDLYHDGEHVISQPVEIAVGDTVRFIAQNHHYTDQVATVLEKKDGRVLIEILTKNPPKHRKGKNESGSGRAIVRTEAKYLSKLEVYSDVG